ncbi:hypothetical protein [Ruminococcus callidus]|uniref:hypothetical protein n=1 Tax=Ruminococcus callidus TaxID=40519 RepID=UPI003992CD46
MQYNFSCSHVETVRRNSLVALAVRLGLANAGGCPCLYLQCWFFEMLLVQAGNLILYGVCKFIRLSSFMYNRFHKELRFFFSLLKRKKEAKKEKSSRFTCTMRQCITRRLHKKLSFIDSYQQKFPGGAYRRLLPP